MAKGPRLYQAEQPLCCESSTSEGLDSYANHEARVRDLLRDRAAALMGRAYAEQALQAHDSYVRAILQCQQPLGEEENQQVCLFATVVSEILKMAMPR